MAEKRKPTSSPSSNIRSDHPPKKRQQLAGTTTAAAATTTTTTTTITTVYKKKSSSSLPPTKTVTPVPEESSRAGGQAQAQAPSRFQSQSQPPVTIDVKNLLPTKVKDGVPLPTVSTPQPELLSSEEYQDYVESAVIGTAIQRSRARWLQDPCFEKYWIKPSKRKQQQQGKDGSISFQNPPRDTMVKLGPCSIIIEPHHFEVMLYIVKGNEVKQQQQQQQQRQTAQPSITTTTTTTTTTHKKQIQQNQQQRQIQQPVMQSGQGLQYQLPQHSQQQTFHQYQPPGQAIQPAPATTAPPPPSHSAAASAPMPTSHGHGHPQSPTYQQGTNPEPLVVQNTNMTASQPQPTPPPLQQQQQQQQQQRQTYTGHSAQQSQHQQQQQHLPPQAQNQLPRTQPAPAPAPAAASQPQLQPQSRPQQQPQQRPPLQPAHPHPTPHQQQQQRISQPPNQQHSQQQPLPPPPPPPKTAQDPVIQMLATRAAADPDLKALMQLVASKRADQSQLRKFQAHIDELHAIIAQRSREAAAAIVQQQQRRQQQQQQQQVQAQQRKPPRQQQQGDANMVIYSPAQSTGGAAPLRSLPQAQAQAQPQPQPLSSQPQQQQQQQQQKYQGYQAAPGATPSSASSHNQGQKGHLTQVLPSTVAYQQQPKHHQQQQQQQRQQPHKPPRAHAPALPKVEPKAVVFEFLTPSSTQIAAAGVVGGNSHSHVSAGDRYLFPANTILDYFPGGTTVIASFLAIKKVDEREPYVDLSVRGNVRGKYQKKSKKEKENEKKDGKDAESSRAQTATAETETEGGSSAAFIEKETGEKKLVNRDGEGSSIKEYYQPVTMRLHASHLRILEPLAKIVNPPAQVRKYMDDVMDRLPRADIEYLALRLPREGSAAAKTEE